MTSLNKLIMDAVSLNYERPVTASSDAMRIGGKGRQGSNSDKDIFPTMTRALT